MPLFIKKSMISFIEQIEFCAPRVDAARAPQALPKVIDFKIDHPFAIPNENPPVNASPAAVVSTGVIGKASRDISSFPL